jgi:2-hydroxychromene-2-carboxylate isomerase
MTPRSAYFHLDQPAQGEIGVRFDANIAPEPFDPGGSVCAVSGDVPLAQRLLAQYHHLLGALRRRAVYRPQPNKLQPTGFPVTGDGASRLLMAEHEPFWRQNRLNFNERKLASV